jgi:protein-disulfide isomerase
MQAAHDHATPAMDVPGDHRGEFDGNRGYTQKNRGDAAQLRRRLTRRLRQLMSSFAVARTNASPAQRFTNNCGGCFAPNLHMTEGTLQPPVGPHDHFLGPVEAPVVLVEYGDYQCPHCARAHDIVQDVLGRLGDRVRYVFRNFPLTDVHPDAGPAAEAAESVAAHGGDEAFWDMHDILFANQDALDVDDLLGYAEAVGVDAMAVADDLSSGRQRHRLRADFDGAMRSGVTGTPTFFINGVRYQGNWTDADALVAALRAPQATSRR